MQEIRADIVIFGAGIAGLWCLNHLRHHGANAILLESGQIGGGQSISSQGIIHSGLKFTTGPKAPLSIAQALSSMPDIWRQSLQGAGPIDLSSASSLVSSQYLLFPRSILQRFLSLAAEKMLAGRVQKLSQKEWPEVILQSGFKGSVVHMDEPVLQVRDVIKALTEPHKAYIRKINWPNGIHFEQEEMGGNIRKIVLDRKIVILPGQTLFTASGGNDDAAQILGHGPLPTQRRPLLMGMMQNAPFALNAHCASANDRPLMTITTHRTDSAENGTGLVWYLGAGAAERAKEDDPLLTVRAAKKVITQFFPHACLENVRWAALPIDRVEPLYNKNATHSDNCNRDDSMKKSSSGLPPCSRDEAGYKRETAVKMPPSPALITYGNVTYGWPTKLTFAPQLAEMAAQRILPSISNKAQPPHTSRTCHNATAEALSSLPVPEIAPYPWEKATWRKMEEF